MRTSTKVAVEKFGKDTPLRGIEVGVQFGIHALELLENLSFSELILCDIWEKYESCGTVFDFTNAYDGVKLLFSGDARVTIRKGTCDGVPGSFDFAYIDADHSLPGVLHDLRTIYPKMKPGGLMAGHDYSAAGNEVIMAVLSFCAENKLTPRFGELRDNDSIDWWINT